MTRGGDPLLGSVIGRYRVERLIGSGGMGNVYLARQPEIGARVAIKVVSADADWRGEAAQRLFAEARTVNLIAHENIVNVVDMVKLGDGRPALVMEYLIGASLDQLIRERREPLPLGSVAQIMDDVLSAVAAAHRAGILHRDLKPANIFITERGRAKVLDFGIAKSFEGAVFGPETMSGRVMGTAMYMAPEQARGEPLDRRTDLFSAGLIAYEAVTGERAFPGPSLLDVAEQHKEPVVPPSQRRTGVPLALESAIMRAIARDPDDRWPDAEKMAAAFRRASAPLADDRSEELTDAVAATMQMPVFREPARATAETSLERPGEREAPPPEEAPSMPQAPPASPPTPSLPQPAVAPRRAPTPAPSPTLVAAPRPRGPRIWAALATAAVAVLAVVLVLHWGGSESSGGAAASRNDGGAAAPGIDAAQPAVDGGVSAADAAADVAVGLPPDLAGRDAARAAAARVFPQPTLSGISGLVDVRSGALQLTQLEYELFSPPRQQVGMVPCSASVVATQSPARARPQLEGCAAARAIDPCPIAEILETFAREHAAGWPQGPTAFEYERGHWRFSGRGRQLELADECP